MIRFKNSTCTFSTCGALFLYPPPSWTKFMGYIVITLSDRLSVCADTCPAVTFFWFDIDLPDLAHETMCRAHSGSRYDVDLWPKVQIYKVLGIFSCTDHNCFLISQGLTIFGTWVYPHEAICRAHSWFRCEIDLWPQGQGQIYRICDMSLCLGHSFFLLWPILTMISTWMYHHGAMCRVHS